MKNDKRQKQDSNICLQQSKNLYILDQTLREPVYAWCKNIAQVLLMNQIQIAHWAVLMKKVYWTPPTYNSLFDILLFTAFTAKQYYCHPNDFPTFTFKLDNDRPGFVVAHSHWVKRNSINIRAWEVNQKFNKLKRPLNGYTQKSFGAQSLSGSNLQGRQQNRSILKQVNQEDDEGSNYDIEAPKNKRRKVHDERLQQVAKTMHQGVQVVHKVSKYQRLQSAKTINNEELKQKRRYSEYQNLLYTIDSGGTDMLGLQNQGQKLQQKQKMQNEIDEVVKQLEKGQSLLRTTTKQLQTNSSSQLKRNHKKDDFLFGIEKLKQNNSQFQDQISDINFLDEELLFQRRTSLTQNSIEGSSNNMIEDEFLPKMGTQKSYLDVPKLQKNQSYL